MTVLCIGCKKDMAKYNYGKTKSILICSNLCFHWMHHHCITEWILSVTNLNSIIKKYGITSTLTETQFKEIGENITPEMRDVMSNKSFNCKCPNSQCNGNIIAYHKFNRLDETPKRRWQKFDTSTDIFQKFQEKQESWKLRWILLVKKIINEFVDELKWRIIPADATVETIWSTHANLRFYIRNIILRNSRWGLDPTQLKYYHQGLEQFKLASTLLKLNDH